MRPGPACGPPTPAGHPSPPSSGSWTSSRTRPAPTRTTSTGNGCSWPTRAPRQPTSPAGSSRDESSQNRYRFPHGFLVGAGETVAVHTGCGDDGPADLYWCAGNPVWNNGGDTALLLDPAGNVAARLRYPG